jgi:thiol-disulfide isomerase/thioredoxin
LPASAALPVVTLGPLAFPAGVIALLAGAIAALAVGGWFQRRGGVSVESMLWWLLALALLGARAAFVLRWWPDYLAHPRDLLNIRDGGFLALPALLVLALATGLAAWRRVPLRTPLTWSVAAGVLVWGFVSLVALRLETATTAPMPALVLQDLDGRPVNLHELRGRPLVINLWATWCGPCRRELPTLAQAQKRMPDVRFVFANQGESAAVVRAFLDAQKLGLDHVLIDDSMQLSQHYNTRAYPTTLFLDAQGHLRDTHTGELSAATLAESLGHVAARDSRTLGSPAPSRPSTPPHPEGS